MMLYHLRVTLALVYRRRQEHLSEAILTDWSASTLVDAIEANGEAWWLYYGHAPQADVHDERELFWLTSGIPIKEYSGVARASFDEIRTPEEIDQHITRIQAYFRAQQMGMQWFMGPSTRPANLGERLAQHGFRLQGAAPGMAAPLERLPAEVAVPPRLEITRVANEAQLQDWAAVAGGAFGEPAEIQQARIAVHAAFGFAEDAPLQRYIARLDGKPVAMSELFLAAGVAGIYDVATVPQARRQGIGAAITHVPLLAARARGYRVGVLEASPMGEPVYRRLGFEEYCRFTLYEWEPGAGAGN
jgi:GNAT superfamily N-acetyltransferase